MNNDNVIITGGVGTITATAADHIALALRGAEAAVDFPGQQQRRAACSWPLRGVRAVLRMGGKAQQSMLPDSNWHGVDSSIAARIAIGVVLLLVLFGAELRLHFGLRLDTIIMVGVIWLFWRYCRRGAAATP